MIRALVLALILAVSGNAQIIWDIDIRGNTAISDYYLEKGMESKVGHHFDLATALEDAMCVTMEYDRRGYVFSGVLKSEHVQFRDGVLVFQVTEAKFDEEALEILEGWSMGKKKTIDRSTLVLSMVNLNAVANFDLGTGLISLEKKEPKRGWLR